jgi:hypothetical protein
MFWIRNEPTYWIELDSLRSTHAGDHYTNIGFHCLFQRLKIF